MKNKNLFGIGLKLAVQSAILVSLMSCRSGAVENQSSGVRLSEAQMRNLIEDVQIAEGVIQHQRNLGNNSDEIKNGYYNLVFLQHHVNQEVFRENLEYYSAQPEILESIYDSVMIRLKTKQDSLQLDKSK